MFFPIQLRFCLTLPVFGMWKKSNPMISQCFNHIASYKLYSLHMGCNNLDAVDRMLFVSNEHVAVAASAFSHTLLDDNYCWVYDVGCSRRSALSGCRQHRYVTRSYASSPTLQLAWKAIGR